MEKRFFKTLDVRLATDLADNGSTTRDQAGAPVLAGYAGVFNSPSEDLGGFIEIVAPGAFSRSLNEADNIFALWSHDMAAPLGSTRGGKLTLTEDATGLAFTLDASRFTPAQLDAAADGELRMSFGFQVVSENWTELADGTIQRTLIDVDLFEVSPVIMPAYPDTSAALRSLEAWKASQKTKADSSTLVTRFEADISQFEEAMTAAAAKAAAAASATRIKFNEADARIKEIEADVPIIDAIEEAELKATYRGDLLAKVLRLKLRK